MTDFSWDFPYPSQRMPILARNCVATSQPLAAQAGLRMLLKGGSAVDAVLATAIALTVLEPRQMWLRESGERCDVGEAQAKINDVGFMPIRISLVAFREPADDRESRLVEIM